MRFFTLLLLVIPDIPTLAYAQAFQDRDGCYVIVDTETGQEVAKENPKRCAERFPPCSTLKPIIAMLGFDHKVIQDDTTVLKWDGKHNEREELNKDQTPVSWMQNSVNWANDQVIAMIGKSKVADDLKKLNYGSKDFSEGESHNVKKARLRISADEQIKIWSQLWAGKLPVSQRAQELTRKITFVETLGKDSRFYGKTGSCCIDAGCERKAARQLGWFVGVLDNGAKKYTFAVNFSDRKPSRDYAGYRAREIAKQLLQDQKLVR